MNEELESYIESLDPEGICLSHSMKSIMQQVYHKGRSQLASEILREARAWCDVRIEGSSPGIFNQGKAETGWALLAHLEQFLAKGG